MQCASAIIVLFFLALPVSAQQAAVAPPPVKQATVEGRVFKAATGEPLRKAWVTMWKVEGGKESYSATTDAGGNFLLKGVQPGRYRLRAWRNGYVSQELGQRLPNQSGTALTLTPDQRVKDVFFRLVPAAVISGRVYDEDGEPLVGVVVQAMRYTYMEGQRRPIPVAFAVTNDLGEYRLHGLLSGRYYVSANYRPGVGGAFEPGGASALASRSGPDLAYAPTYYPGTNDPARAVPIELHEAEESSGIDITFLPTTGVTVRGQVLNSITGQPGRRSFVVLTSRDPVVRNLLFMPTVVDDPQGRFEIHNVTPGSYFVTAQWNDGGKMYVGRQAIEVANADVEGLSVVIGAGLELRGRVRVEGDVPMDLADLQVWLKPSSDVPMSIPTAAVKSDGSFTFSNVTADLYRLLLRGLREDSYLKSATLSGDDILEAGLDLATGQAPGMLDIVVSASGGRLEGSVLCNQELLPGARVVLVPDASRRAHSELYKTVTTDQNGRFTLQGIVPGEYKLFAWQAIELGAYEDPDVLRAFEDKGIHVRIQEGARLSMQVEAIPSAEHLR
jgi:hypothetical protein